MVCTPDLYYQEFKVQGAELKAWKHKFLKRLDMFHELQHDEKERTTPMKGLYKMNEEPAARTRAKLEKTKGRHRAKIEILNEMLNWIELGKILKIYNNIVVLV